MIDLPSMWNAYFFSIITDPISRAIVISSTIASVIFYLLFRRTDKLKTKILFLYGHIFFLFSPFIITALLWKCAMQAYECAPMTTIYVIAGSMAILLIAGFMILPHAYQWADRSKEITNRKIKLAVKKWSEALSLAEPRLYTVNDVTPLAYSITHTKPAIYLSAGLCEILNEKELEAVLLHELCHIKNKTSIWKLSAYLLKIFSPLSALSSTVRSLNHEETEADAFSVKMQGTAKFLKSAKRKVNSMNNKLTSSLALKDGHQN